MTTWLTHGGLLPLFAIAMTAAGLLVSVVSGLDPRLRDLFMGLGAIGAVVCCWRAIRAPSAAGAIRRPAALAFGAVAVSSLSIAVPGFVLEWLPESIALGALASGSLLGPPLLAIALFLWPRNAGSQVDKRYVAVDLGIIFLAVTLFVWYVRFSPAARAQSVGGESLFILISSVVLLISIGLAVLRGPDQRFAVPFLMLVTWGAIAFIGNPVLSLLKLSDAMSIIVVAPIGLIAFGMGLMSTEALRLGWRWPGTRGSVEGASPVPWLAVAAIGGFVLIIGIQELRNGVGVIVIGAVATMVLLGIRQAITMRHNAELQAERAILAADARIAAMVRHTSDVILIVDESSAVRYVSPSAEALWGRPASELVGVDLRDLIEGSARGAVQRMLSERIARPGQTESARWRIQGKEGIRRVEAVVISLLHEPSVHGVVISLRDETDRIQLEEQLNQSQKMEAVGQLAGGVAHDFNNLLTTILGHAEVGLDMLGNEHPVREDLIQIKRASELAASLTRQLLAFSRKQVIEPKVVDVAVSLEQVVRLLKRLIKEHVTTVLDVGAEVGRVRVDPSQLEQVVLNLAVNARDAMPSGGVLTIRARTETVTGPVPNAVIPVPVGECVVVEVIDNGTGMDATTQTRIFEPFFTTKPPGRGTGLGLSSVYGIVKHSGAGLVLKSAPGRGSTFSVYFNRVLAVQEITPADSSGESTGPRVGATILLVEDETGLREIAHKVLAKEGFRVLVAADAEDALTLAASAPFPIDLLLTDVVMPGMSGPKLARELKAARPGLRILFMSGYPGDDLTGELKPDQRFLRKPFTPFVLLEHVRSTLEGTADPTSTRPDPR